MAQTSVYPEYFPSCRWFNFLFQLTNVHCGRSASKRLGGWSFMHLSGLFWNPQQLFDHRSRVSCRMTFTPFHLAHCSFGLHLLVAFFVGRFVYYGKKHCTASKHFWCLQPCLITSRLHSLEEDILFNCVTWGWPFGHPCILPLCCIPIVLLKGFQDTRVFSGFTFLLPAAFLTPASLELIFLYISENCSFLSY